jgi:hypothetical protein
MTALAESYGASDVRALIASIPAKSVKTIITDSTVDPPVFHLFCTHRCWNDLPFDLLAPMHEAGLFAEPIVRFLVGRGWLRSPSSSDAGEDADAT